MPTPRNQLMSPRAVRPTASGHRSGGLAMLAHTKKKSAKPALAQPEASPPTTGSMPEQSLATLRDMMRRLISEESSHARWMLTKPQRWRMRFAIFAW